MLANLAAGKVVCDRYRILSLLGRGGMGTVFKAEDLALRRLVALKILELRNAFAEDDDDPQREERFLREASLNAQLSHPNIVHVYDVGRGTEGVDTFCYIAMELLHGESLGERVRRARTGLPISEILPIGTQIVKGLRAAHQRGMAHRDLKPDNIMLTPGEDGDEMVKILDFGLAKEITSAHELGHTDAGTIMGTPEYMSPEQVNAQKVDARTDLYSFGILLYECITGAPPFRGENAYRVAAAHLGQPVPPMKIPADRPRLSTALEELVRKLLEKRVNDRVQTADDLLRRLRDLPESRSLQARSVAEALSLSTTSRYQTGRKLSETSRAIVFDATHLELGRQVAIKVFRANSPSEQARLRRELPTFAVLRHNANVRVLDVGMTSEKADGRPFLVMERVRGPTLRALLSKNGALPWRRAVDIAITLLDGLGEAHTVGLLHRHLTPEHVLIANENTRRETAKIFGYRVTSSGGEGSEPALPVVPEAGYLAPELMRGQPMSERSDLYAVGALLFESVLGRLPSAASIDVRSGDASAKAQADVPVELAEILRRAVSIDPSERFETAADFASALAAVRLPLMDSDPSSDDPASMRTSLQQRLRSTGQPSIWFLTGDPALRKTPLPEVMLQLRGHLRVEEIAADHRAAFAKRLRDEEEIPPWVVVFGGMHVILEDPLLAALGHAPEVSRLLISTHANTELLEAAINFCGLDHHVTLPALPEAVRAAVEKMVTRSGAARRYYDDLRLLSQRNTPVSGLGQRDSSSQLATR